MTVSLMFSTANIQYDHSLINAEEIALKITDLGNLVTILHSYGVFRLFKQSH